MAPSGPLTPMTSIFRPHHPVISACWQRTGRRPSDSDDLLAKDNIQTQLGHASIQTTLDRYGHLMPDAHAAEARKLDRLVFGGSSHAGTVRVAADALQRLQNGSRNDEGVSGGDR